jgi:hypothetical protein
MPSSKTETHPKRTGSCPIEAPPPGPADGHPLRGGAV